MFKTLTNAPFKRRHLLRVLCVCASVNLFYFCHSKPLTLSTPAQKADYLVGHYWQHFNFSDSNLIDNPRVTEQAFANYIDLFRFTPDSVIQNSIAALLNQAIAGSERMFLHMLKLSEKYLHDPNSPHRQERYYILFLKAVVNNPDVADLHKIRPRYQLTMALKNKVGDRAADFTFVDRNGETGSLHTISADYTLLFFNNPECHDCGRVKEILTTSTMVRELQQSKSPKRLRIVAVYPDQDVSLWLNAHYPLEWINVRSSQLNAELLYDLRAIPALYLLDQNKRVILKDTPVEELIYYLISAGL